MHPKPIRFTIFLKIFLTAFLFGAIPIMGIAAFIVFRYERAIFEFSQQLTLLGAQDQALDIERSVILLRLHLTALAFLLYAAVVVGSILVSIVIVRPILRLVSGIEKVTAGDLSIQLHPSSSDEIGLLTARFNRMVEWLRVVKAKKEMFQRTKGEFFSLAFHHARAIFSKIKWSLATVLEEDEGSITVRQKALLQESLSASNELMGAISELMELNTIETGEQYAFKEAQLEDLLKDTFETLKPLAVQKNLAYRMILPQEKTPMAFVDEARLASAVFRLLQNAIAYTKESGKVTLTLEAKPEAVAVSVADTGIGIPADELPFIFSKFFRGKKAIALGKAGIGIELYTARYIVRRHGGDLNVVSKEGEGSTFTATLPYDRSRIPASEETILT